MSRKHRSRAIPSGRGGVERSFGRAPSSVWVRLASAQSGPHSRSNQRFRALRQRHPCRRTTSRSRASTAAKPPRSECPPFVIARVTRGFATKILSVRPTACRDGASAVTLGSHALALCGVRAGPGPIPRGDARAGAPRSPARERNSSRELSRAKERQRFLGLVILHTSESESEVRCSSMPVSSSEGPIGRLPSSRRSRAKMELGSMRQDCWCQRGCCRRGFESITRASFLALAHAHQSISPPSL